MNAQNALVYVMCGLLNKNAVGPLYLSHFVQFTNYLMTRPDGYLCIIYLVYILINFSTFT